MIRTTDGGHTWARTGTMNAPIAPPEEPGVLDVDFADSQLGWAYGPSLQRTVDGGRTWHPAALPGKGKQVAALLAEPDQVFMVVSPCEIGQRSRT